MSDLRVKIARLLCGIWEGDDKWDEVNRSTRAAYVGDASRILDAIKAKPLEFEKTVGGPFEVWNAAAPGVGVLYIIQNGPGAFNLYCGGEDCFDGEHPTLEAAQAAAEEHWQKTWKEAMG